MNAPLALLLHLASSLLTHFPNPSLLASFLSCSLDLFLTLSGGPSSSTSPPRELAAPVSCVVAASAVACARAWPRPPAASATSRRRCSTPLGEHTTAPEFGRSSAKRERGSSPCGVLFILFGFSRNQHLSFGPLINTKNDFLDKPFLPPVAYLFPNHIQVAEPLFDFYFRNDKCFGSMGLLKKKWHNFKNNAQKNMNPTDLSSPY